MPYGTLSEINQRSYTMVITSVAHIGEYPVIITCSASTDNMNNETELPGIWQSFVDFVGDGGSNFNILSDTRTKTFEETVTPTP